MPSISVNYTAQKITELEQYILTLPIPQSLTDVNPLTDIIQTVPNDGDILIFSQGLGKWIITSSPSGSLANLSDVQFTVPPVLDNILVYDGSKWINVDISIKLDPLYL